MKRTIYFIISFLTFILFLILFFQNINPMSSAYTYILGSEMYISTASVLVLGFIMGAIFSIFCLLFIIGGGNIKITSAKSENDGDISWD